MTLRRHKAAAASSSSSARALNYEYADGVDYRGLTAFASLSMAVSGGAQCAPLFSPLFQRLTLLVNQSAI
ncbi:hypothetical protein [Candidatus Reidiella endopervernicosa]|uniref:Uncharacterized protein n=1 Tax=Candidatus Reidiella endopervernicosa TaxID=2738883 RepID=A0A6N0HRQ8_9GAMM|nr:hypothetical protein [Candidatus Reidiella endopervernicosa]QKQ24941.1 hypothetical protein HUE57_00545 [Candidatus Reidiella endopervernicosa]